MATIDKKMLKNMIISFIKEDPEVRRILREVLSEEFVSKEEIRSILERIDKLINELKISREDFNARMLEMREDFNRRMDSFEEHLKALERRMDSFEERMLEMREDFNRHMRAFAVRLNGLGARWGIMNEASVRRALRGLVGEYFGWKVERWEVFDEKGIVYGHPSMIDVDVVIKDKRHILIEVKSHVRKSDVAELLRISEVYEEKVGVKPELMIVSPYIDKDAQEFAKIKGIKIYTSDELILGG